jgi:hypothetical protein
MPNMSYCRFENTANDLEECLEAMNAPKFDREELSSEREKRGYDRLLELCKDIACDFCDCSENE